MLSIVNENGFRSGSDKYLTQTVPKTTSDRLPGVSGASGERTHRRS